LLGAGKVRLFRFFISSTFTEFDGERGALQREIFPRLTEFGRHKGVLVQPIDLRWGISEAAARERRTVDICLEEIRRCRRLSPGFHFLALVGTRIGWRPPPAELSPEAVQAAGLEQWYRRDDNAVPAQAVLDPSAPDEVVTAALEAADLCPPPITHLEIAEGILSQADGRHALIYCRDEDCVDTETTALRDRLHSHPGLAVRSWSADILARIEADLTERIDALSTTPPLPASVAMPMVGREADRDRLTHHLDHGGGSPVLLVTGRGGIGKTTLLAAAADRVGQRAHLLGTAQAAESLAEMLRVIHSGLGVEPGPEAERQQLVLPSTCAGAMVIDNLDALGEEATSLRWLPDSLPDGVRLVLSQRQLPEPMPPGVEHLALDRLAEDATLLSGWLDGVGRTLTASQRQAVLDAAGGVPLHLQLLFDQARHWRSFDPAEPLAPSMEATLRHRLDQLVHEHGRQFATVALGLIAAGRFGTTEAEIVAGLGDHAGVMTEMRERYPHFPWHGDEPPPVLWSRLRLDLEGLLTETTVEGVPVLRAFHAVLAEVLAPLATPDCHRLLAAQQERTTATRLLEDVLADDGVARRLTRELPRHLLQGGQTELARECLHDFAFALAKCAAGHSDDLVEDHRLLDGSSAWSGFLEANAAILRRGDSGWPAHKILLQRAAEAPHDHPVRAAAEAWLAAPGPRWPWLRRVGEAPEHGLGSMVLEGHEGKIAGCFPLSGNRLLSWGGYGQIRLWNLVDGTSAPPIILSGGDDIARLLMLRDGRGLAWTTDGDIAEILPAARRIVWRSDDAQPTIPLAELLPGQTLRAGPYQRLQVQFVTDDGRPGLRLCRDDYDEVAAHPDRFPDRLFGLTVLEDGGLLAWSWNAVSLWTTGGVLRHRLEAPLGVITKVRLLDDGGLICAAEGEAGFGRAGTVTIWDWTGTRPRLPAIVAYDAMAVQGRLVSWGESGDIEVRSLFDGDLLGTLDLHRPAQVMGVLPLDDTLVASWDTDGTIATWDAATGEVTAVHRLHSGVVRGLRWLADGRLLSWGDDGLLRAWEPGQTIEAEPRPRIKGRLLWPDGRLLLWSGGGTVEGWDCRAARPILKIEGAGEVEGAVWLDCGRVVSWGFHGDVRLWSADGASLWRAEPFWHPVNGVFASSPGRLAAWSDDHDYAVLLDEGSGAVVGRLRHERRLWGLAPADDGRLISWSDDGTVRLWDGRDGRAGSVYRGGNTLMINTIQLIGGGRVLAVPLQGEFLQVWGPGGIEAYRPIADSLGWGWRGATEAGGCLFAWSSAGDLCCWEPGRTDPLWHCRPSPEALSGVVIGDGAVVAWSHAAGLRWRLDPDDGRVCDEEDLASPPETEPPTDSRCGWRLETWNRVAFMHHPRKGTLRWHGTGKLETVGVVGERMVARSETEIFKANIIWPHL